MTYTEWLSIVQPFLQQLISLIANLVLAIAIFIIGYFISVGIGKLVSEVLKAIKFNKLFEKEGWRRALQRANLDMNPSEFIGAIFKWIFVIVFLVVAVDVLKLTAFTVFLTQVLDYLPNVVVAVLVFVVAVIISDIVEKVVIAAMARLKVSYAYLAASIVKWAIWVFAFFLVLDQLLPNSLLIKTLYTSIVYGIVGALALGVAIAIGLGGKDTAAKIIEDTYRKIEEK
jgi:hypothetical protein